MTVSENVTRLPIRAREHGKRGLHVVQSTFTAEKCRHTPDGNTYEVDDAAGTVECGKCGAKLSPTWVLLQLAHAESIWLNNRDRHHAMLKKLEARSRAKCDHCGKMTSVRP
jgi:transcription elongation factor Elf1